MIPAEVKFINLTEETIRIRLESVYDADMDGMNEPALPSDIVVEPTDPPARVEVTSTPAGSIRGTPLVRYDVRGLPEPQEGVVYIVSLEVLTAMKIPRADVVALATGPNDKVVRSNGRVFAVTRLLTQ